MEVSARSSLSITEFELNEIRPELGLSLNSNQTPEIVQIIFKECVQENSKQSETKCLKVSRIALKTASFGMGIGGAIPNIAVAMKLGGDNVALGVSVATANFITRTCLVTWSYHNIIDGEIGQNGKIKRKIAHKKLNCCERTTVKIVVMVIAIIAQTPRAIIALRYNGSIVYLLLTYGALSAIPAQSLDLSVKAAIDLKKLTKYEQSLNEIKKIMAKNIQECRLKVLQLPANERKTLLTSFMASGDQSIDSAVMAFFSRVCREGNLSSKPQTMSQKIRTVASRVLGTLTAGVTIAAQCGFNFWVGVQGSKALLDNPYFNYTLGAVILASNAYLTTKVMITRSQGLSHQLFFKPKELLTGSSITSVLMPKIRGSAGLVAIGTSGFSTGTMVQASRDYFSGELAIAMQVLVPLAMFILGHQATSDLVDKICLETMMHCGVSETEKEILKLDQALERLFFIIQTMSFKHFAKFLLALPDDLFLSFTAQKTNKEELMNYLDLSQSRSKK